MKRPHLSEKQLKYAERGAFALTVAASIGALSLYGFRSENSSESTMAEISPPIASASATSNERLVKPFNKGPIKKEIAGFEPIPYGYIKNVQIDAINIDKAVNTVKLPIEDGVAQYSPSTLEGIESANVEYYYSGDEHPDFVVGKVGINKNGEIPDNRKIVLYGHTGSGDLDGVLDNLTELKVKSKNEPGDILVTDTNYGTFTYEAVGRVIPKKAVERSTPELDKSMPSGDLFVLTCLLTDDGQEQTGKRVIYIFNLVNAVSK